MEEEELDEGSFLSSLGGVAKSVLPFAAPVLGLLGGLFGDSPEEQHKKAQEENRRRMIEAIKTNAAVQRARVQRRADRDVSLSNQAGARQAAATGYRGDVSAFTLPGESRVRAGADETLQQINESEMSSIANANAQGATLPSYSFPNSFDYLTSGVKTVSDYFNQQELLQLERERLRHTPTYS
jgi:hypothetical protein